MTIAVGVDIGGSHITSAAVDLDTYSTIPDTIFRESVDSKADKESIFSQWAASINQTLAALKTSEIAGIAFAMPGPFQYDSGVALFQGNDKYESLYNISVTKELKPYLSRPEIELRFLNDASCFGVGSSLRRAQPAKNIVAITLGTGFGAAFLKDNLPLVNHAGVPEYGCLWDKPFLDSIADDYFSTRWFINTYQEKTKIDCVAGVKEIVEKQNDSTAEIFSEFSQNLSDFLIPYLSNFDTELLILGGNIAKSHNLFLPGFIQKLKSNQINTSVYIENNTELSIIIGASYLYNKVFWKKIKNDLVYF